MARIDTLANFITDIATAIKNKTGKTDSITPANFDTEIESIQSSGGDEELETSFISSIDSSLGANCTKLPSGLTSIGPYAFYNCSKLALTELPSGLTSISYQAFNGCTNLTLTKLPSGLTSIGQQAFANCSKLALTELPSSLITLDSMAFNYCSNLAITEIPSGVTVLQNQTFYKCTNLKELTINGAVTTIAGYVFNGCTNLAKIVIPNITSVPTLSATNTFTSTPIASGTGYIYVPDDLVDSFKTATNWSTYADQIKGIGELA